MHRIIPGIYKKLYSAYGRQYWWPAASALEVMIGAILTQNTNWQNVEKAVDSLKKARAMSIRRLKEMPVKKLASYIRPAGYFNIKARRLKEFINFICREYGGRLSAMKSEKTGILRQKLLSINGIGPETADSILLYALNRPVFVVDAYTRRVAERHRMINPAASYSDIQRLFTDNLPHKRQLFNEYHALIVRLGKEHCRKTPHCAGCPLERNK